MGELAAEDCAPVYCAVESVKGRTGKEEAMLMQAIDLTDLEVVEESAVQSAATNGGVLCGIGCDGLVCGLWCGR